MAEFIPSRLEKYIVCVNILVHTWSIILKAVPFYFCSLSFCILYYLSDCAVGEQTSIDVGRPEWGPVDVAILEEFYHETLGCTGYIPPDDYKLL